MAKAWLDDTCPAFLGGMRRGGWRGEGEGEELLIILIQKPTTMEGREKLKLSVNVHRKETSSVIVDIKKQ